MGISTIIMAGAAVASAGTAGYGLYEQSEGRSASTAAAQEQARIAGLQAQESASAALEEAGLQAQSAAASVAASEASTTINKNIIGGEQAIEAQKLQAMRLTSSRAQLEILRDEQRKLALGLTVGVAQGAQFGSGVQGAKGQIAGQAGTNILGERQNLQIGENIFAANAGISAQRLSLFDLQNLYAKQQADLQTQQSMLKARHAQEQAGLTTQYTAAGSQLATGQGQSAFGSSFVSAAPSIFAVGQVGSRFATSALNPTQPGAPISLAVPTAPTGPAYTPSNVGFGSSSSYIT
jgi:hypothetical protein